MSQILALVGSSAASAVGVKPLWEGIAETAISTNTYYISFDMETAPYNAYDMLWFRIKARHASSSGNNKLTWRVDGNTGSYTYIRDHEWAGSGWSGHQPGQSQNFGEIDYILADNSDDAYTYGLIDFWVTGLTTQHGVGSYTENPTAFYEASLSNNSPYMVLGSTAIPQSPNTLQFGCGGSHGNQQFMAHSKVEVYGGSLGY
tara:strand:- start:2549 stop:3154 length:606 start_codon:yes stop_codon:yes gene_type:complete